MQLIMTLHKQF